MVQGFQEQESRRRERASEPGTTPPDPVRAKAAEKATANPRASEPAAAMNMSALGVVLRARRGRQGPAPTAMSGDRPTPTSPLGAAREPVAHAKKCAFTLMGWAIGSGLPGYH
jgi:hypothetical protein